MADQGVWFKLWCSALDDPDLDNLALEDFARWTKLGVLIKRQGTGGELRLTPPARGLCAMFQVPDYQALIAAFLRLPNVHIKGDEEHVAFETVAFVSCVVSFHNWAKYQGDFSTHRVTRWRQVKRLRREETKKRRDSPPIPRPDDLSITRRSDQPEAFGAVLSRLGFPPSASEPRG